jgi:hypothetical protein
MNKFKAIAEEQIDKPVCSDAEVDEWIKWFYKEKTLAPTGNINHLLNHPMENRKLRTIAGERVPRPLDMSDLRKVYEQH